MNPSSSYKESGGGSSGETTAKVDLLELKLGFGTTIASSSSTLPSSQSTKKSQQNITSLGLNQGFEALNRRCHQVVIPNSSSAPAPAPAAVERYNNGLRWAHNHKKLGLFVSRASSSDERRAQDEYEYDCSLPSPLLGTLFWSAFPCNDGSHQYYYCSQTRPQPAAGLWFSLRSIINRDGEVLPQVQKAYIRVKNENLTVIMVKTYLVRKLGLSNESQVEISCMGQNLLEYQELKKVRDEIWLPKLVEKFQSSNQKSVQNSHISSNHLIMPLDYGKCCLYIYN